MRLACLQFAPRLGEVERNISRADEVLLKANIDDVDWIVLPELAFSGYNFDSAEHIRPYLEPTGEGPSALWAIATAAKYQCLVTIGYPEISSETFDDLHLLSTSSELGNTTKATAGLAAGDIAPLGTDERNDVLEQANAIPVPGPRPSNDGFKWFNSTITVNPAGEVVHHYRKTFLYYTDASWAQPGKAFGNGSLQIGKPGQEVESEVKFVHGICMDINPCGFTADWSDYEFGRHLVTSEAQIAVVSMAWLSQELFPIDTMGESGKLPDVQTIAYWVSRLEPALKQDKDVIVLCANRCGTEGTATYAGSSTIMKLGRRHCSLWAFLGKGEEAVLLVDTIRDTPMYQMVSRTDTPTPAPNGETSDGHEEKIKGTKDRGFESGT